MNKLKDHTMAEEKLQRLLDGVRILYEGILKIEISIDTFKELLILTMIESECDFWINIEYIYRFYDTTQLPTSTLHILYEIELSFISILNITFEKFFNLEESLFNSWFPIPIKKIPPPRPPRKSTPPVLLRTTDPVDALLRLSSNFPHRQSQRSKSLAFTGAITAPSVPNSSPLSSTTSSFPNSHHSVPAPSHPKLSSPVGDSDTSYQAPSVPKDVIDDDSDIQSPEPPSLDDLATDNNGTTQDSGEESMDPETVPDPTKNDTEDANLSGENEFHTIVKEVENNEQPSEEPPSTKEVPEEGNHKQELPVEQDDPETGINATTMEESLSVTMECMKEIEDIINDKQTKQTMQSATKEEEMQSVILVPAQRQTPAPPPTRRAMSPEPMHRPMSPPLMHRPTSPPPVLIQIPTSPIQQRIQINQQQRFNTGASDIQQHLIQRTKSESPMRSRSGVAGQTAIVNSVTDGQGSLLLNSSNKFGLILKFKENSLSAEDFKNITNNVLSKGNQSKQHSHNFIRRAIVTKHHLPSSYLELPLFESQLISIISNDQIGDSPFYFRKGWWCGNYNGLLGWFPSSYVSPLLFSPFPFILSLSLPGQYFFPPLSSASLFPILQNTRSSFSALRTSFPPQIILPLLSHLLFYFPAPKN